MMGLWLLLLEGSYTSDCSMILNALNRNLVSRYLRHPPLWKYWNAAVCKCLPQTMTGLNTAASCCPSGNASFRTTAEGTVQMNLQSGIFCSFTSSESHMQDLQVTEISILYPPTYRKWWHHGNCTGRKRTNYNPYSNQATLRFGVF